MTSLINDQVVTEEPIPAVRRLDSSAPLRWLGNGWDDLKVRPVVSIAYGLVFVIAGIFMIQFGPARIAVWSAVAGKPWWGMRISCHLLRHLCCEVGCWRWWRLR